MKKHIGFVGLGKMGENMVLNLLGKKYKVVAYNRNPQPTKKIARHKGIVPTYDYKELIKNIPKPRAIIIMVTAGKPVESVVKELSGLLERGDTIIDGGNSYYEDSVRRHKELKKKGINFLDMGTSGGLTGARHGASLMIGGDKKTYKKLEPLFRDLSVKNGYSYMGTSGAGHFVKVVHNGIEYALLEAYAEGYEILSKSKYNLDMKDVSKVWSNGSVIRSWITELAERVFKKCGNNIKCVVGRIGGGETGRWTLKIAKKLGTDPHTLQHALTKRKKSLKQQSFATRFVSAIRQEFGGHNEP